MVAEMFAVLVVFSSAVAVKRIYTECSLNNYV